MLIIDSNNNSNNNNVNNNKDIKSKAIANMAIYQTTASTITAITPEQQQPDSRVDRFNCQPIRIVSSRRGVPPIIIVGEDGTCVDAGMGLNNHVQPLMI